MNDTQLEAIKASIESELGRWTVYDSVEIEEADQEDSPNCAYATIHFLEEQKITVLVDMTNGYPQLVIGDECDVLTSMDELWALIAATFILDKAQLEKENTYLRVNRSNVAL